MGVTSPPPSRALSDVACLPHLRACSREGLIKLILDPLRERGYAKGVLLALPTHLFPGWGFNAGGGRVRVISLFVKHPTVYEKVSCCLVPACVLLMIVLHAARKQGPGWGATIPPAHGVWGHLPRPGAGRFKAGQSQGVHMHAAWGDRVKYVLRCML